MKKYYIISFTLFIMLFVGVLLANIIVDGETIIMPVWSSVVFLIILINTLVVTVCFMINPHMENKIKKRS